MQSYSTCYWGFLCWCLENLLVLFFVGLITFTVYFGLLCLDFGHHGVGVDCDCLSHVVRLVDAHQFVSQLEHVVSKTDYDELTIFGHHGLLIKDLGGR